jgi:hypothetical protein
MFLSSRQAAVELARVGLARDQARQVLATGLAGPGIRTAGALLYDEAKIHDLRRRPTARNADLDPRCRAGMFVTRGRHLDCSAPRSEQLASVCGGWRLSPFTVVLMQTRAERGQPLPFIATVGGFVILGAEIHGVRGTTTAATLDLGNPGPWFDAFRDKRFETGRGGPWILWTS